MFTGIVQALGTVRSLQRRGDDALLEVETTLDLSDLSLGDSVAVNGACLTVTALKGNRFMADVSAESLDKTNLGALKSAERINLEKALRPLDFIGGHLVLGHVDGAGVIREKTAKSGSIIFGIDVDKALTRYIVEKGSITVDGISLTVNRCNKNRFYVNMIPHTAQMTTLGFKKVSDVVNIETDIIGKYVEKLMGHDADSGGKLDLNFLSKHGFVR
ncbi:MAG: Riboflavin synthase [Syntrophus sp. SKADARSKE-3]|nr:Riboflavin synthase [Syntrophus sp. SKADARSKE-3]